MRIELDNVSEMFSINELDAIHIDMGGIYFLYNLEGDLIYLGRSICLQKRLDAHFKGTTHTKYFHKEFASFRVMYTNSRVEQKIYELYAIHALKPKYNQADVYDEAPATSKNHLGELEKDKLVSFVVKLMKMNKAIPVGINTMKIICENNNLLSVDLFDAYVLSKLKENNVHLNGREFVYKRA